MIILLLHKFRNIVDSSDATESECTSGVCVQNEMFTAMSVLNPSLAFEEKLVMIFRFASGDHENYKSV